MDKEKYLGRLRSLITQLERTEKKIAGRRAALTALEADRNFIKAEIQTAALDDLNGPQANEE